MLKHIAVSAAALLVSTGVFAEEADIELSEVPQKVMEAAKKKVEGFEPASAGYETVDGKKVYEIAGTAGGKEIEVDVAEDGTVEEVETVIAAEDVPAKVMDAVKAEMPNFKADEIEMSERPDGVWYELDGMDGDKEVEIEIKEDGTGLKAED